MYGLFRLEDNTKSLFLVEVESTRMFPIVVFASFINKMSDLFLTKDGSMPIFGEVVLLLVLLFDPKSVAG